MIHAAILLLFCVTVSIFSHANASRSSAFWSDCYWKLKLVKSDDWRLKAKSMQHTTQLLEISSSIQGVKNLRDITVSSSVLSILNY